VAQPPVDLKSQRVSYLPQSNRKELIRQTLLTDPNHPHISTSLSTRQTETLKTAYPTYPVLLAVNPKIYLYVVRKINEQSQSSEYVSSVPARIWLEYGGPPMGFDLEGGQNSRLLKRGEKEDLELEIWSTLINTWN
jgi:hypothetical protein